MSELRYGIVGAGMMGVEHIRNIAALDGARVSAIADPHQPSIDAALAACAGDVAVFADHRELLESGQCDAVVIATPNMTHVDVLLDILGHHRAVHVLVEKPLCTTVDDCREVITAAQRHEGVVQVGLEYRYMPPVARLVADCDAGAVGTVRMLAIREHRFPFLTKVGDWNRFNANTGGTLVEKCCHFFDLMARIIRAEPVRVLASGGHDVNHRDEEYGGRRPDILDNAFVIVDFEGGARASLDLCMFAEGSRNQEEISVVGDTGKLEALLPSSTFRSGRRDRGSAGVHEEHVADTAHYEGFHHGSSYIEHTKFLDAIRSGSPPEVTLTDGLRSVAMGVAAHRSIDEGRVVTMAEVLG